MNDEQQPRRRRIITPEPIIRERRSKKNLRPSPIELRAKEQHNRQQRRRGAEANLEKMKAAAAADAKKYTANIPFYVLDEYLHKLSRTATCILLTLLRHATFDPEKPKFAMCWLTHKQIAEYTGISEGIVRRYEKELEENGLIGVSYSQGADGGGYKTIHIYTLYFMKIFNKAQK